MNTIKQNRRKTKGITSIPGLFLTMVIGAFCYFEYTSIGFPDGHLSEYERFLKSILVPLIFSINTLFMISFLWLLVRGIKKHWILMLYVIFIVLASAITWYFSISLENGQGG